MKHDSDHQWMFLKYNIDIVLIVNVTVPESTEGNFHLYLGICAENNVLQY